jgi:hypothetical protein
MDRYSIFWLDPTAQNRRMEMESLQQIGSPVNQVTTASSPDECVNHIQYNRSPALVIVNGTFGQNLTQRIHNLSQVKAIYVYCMDVDGHKRWASSFSKVKCIDVVE